MSNQQQVKSLKYNQRRCEDPVTSRWLYQILLSPQYSDNFNYPCRTFVPDPILWTNHQCNVIHVSSIIMVQQTVYGHSKSYSKTDKKCRVSLIRFFFMTLTQFTKYSLRFQNITPLNCKLHVPKLKVLTACLVKRPAVNTHFNTNNDMWLFLTHCPNLAALPNEQVSDLSITIFSTITLLESRIYHYHLTITKFCV